MSSLVIAVIVGLAFGFALDRVGASNPGYIIRMLNLTNMHLMKTILLGVGVASVLTFGGLMLGLVDPAHFDVKTAYLGVFVGGLMLGVGFAVAGYCPGTGLVALAAGRKDALFFLAGGLLGAFAYALAYSGVKATGILDGILGGKTAIGAIPGTQYPALIASVPGEVLGIVLGLVFILVATLLPARILGDGRPAGRAAPAE